MQHDLFSGEAVAINYRDVARADEVVLALNDDSEIDDILM